MTTPIPKRCEYLSARGIPCNKLAQENGFCKQHINTKFAQNTIKTRKLEILPTIPEEDICGCGGYCTKIKNFD